jgi:dienelactone hydrolase
MKRVHGGGAVKSFKCFTLSFTDLALTVLIVCCGGGQTALPPITVEVTPSTAMLQPGSTAQFSATVTDDSANKGVTWSVSCSTAPCGSVSPTTTSSGAATTYTAPTIQQGSLKVTVTATSVADTSKSGSGSITVTMPNLAVTVMPGSSTVQPGAATRFTAIVTNDPANKGVTWSISCGAASCGTVSPSASLSGAAVTYSAPSTPTAGDLFVSLVATSVTNTAATAGASITVPGINVSVMPGSATVQPGATAKFIVTVTGDPANKGVTWSVSCPAACGTVSPGTTASGGTVTYTAPTTQPAGDLSVVLIATSITNTAATATANITVPGLDVSVTPDSATVQTGTTAQFAASVTNDAANKGVTWTVSCSQAPCGSVSPTSTATGVSTTYTAPSSPPTSDLSVTITATSVTNTASSSSANVTVPAITVSPVTPAGVLLPVNLTQQFSASINNDPSNAEVTWTLTQTGTACSPSCGGVSPSITANGSPTTYTAPAAVPASPTVTFSATSVADPTKSVSATITVSAGTVKLVPNILNLGRVLVGQTSSQTATLTNTGNAALSITGITIAGADPSVYSESNTCGASVAATSSCTITATFKPGGLGTVTADVAVADNSKDTPQQISLSGIGYSKNPDVNAVAGSISAGPSAEAAPRPSGSRDVGTHIVDLIDSSRDDPYLAAGTKRELLVRFWYPATLNEACKPAAYTPAEVWSYFSELVGASLPEVQTNSCEDAPVADGAHPIVVFTPGYTATFTDYTFLFEDLASRGYLVASVDHTYEATAVEFPDGRFVKSVFGSHLGNTLEGDDQALSFATSVRLQDLKFVVNELERLNVQAASPFAGKLDLSRIAVAGHSMGGATAFLAAEQDPRFRAGIVMDGFVPDDSIKATQTPVLILAAGRQTWSEDECRVWSNLQGPRLAVNLQGAEHVTLSDAVWIARDAVHTGTMGPDKTVAAVRDYIAAFLDANLRGNSMGPLLMGPSSDYPDAVVTTQGTSLCGRR